MPRETCDIFGCLRSKAEPVVVIEIAIGEEVAEPEVCTEHKEFFQTAPSSLYDVGFTYRHEVEVRPRPIPASPAPE